MRFIDCVFVASDASLFKMPACEDFYVDNCIFEALDCKVLEQTTQTDVTLPSVIAGTTICNSLFENIADDIFYIKTTKGINFVENTVETVKHIFNIVATDTCIINCCNCF